jgi:hypothetical protein
MPITIVPASITPQLDAQGDAIKARIQKATVAAVQKLSDNILQKGRADMASAGNFSSARWQQGLTADISGDGASRTITISHAVSYWKVFQDGATIHGKPLLWIPFGNNKGPFPGRLFFVQPKSGGAPLMMSADDKQAKLHGHDQVTIPKKWHLVEIAQTEAKTLGALFRVEMGAK